MLEKADYSRISAFFSNRSNACMDNFYCDLTEGNIARQLIKFSWPFLLSTFLQALYNIVDMLVVGIYVGPVGISAVTTGSQMLFIITFLVVGMAVGGTVLIAQYLGAKQHHELSATIGSMFSLYAISAVVLTVLMLVFSNNILQLMQTPAQAMADAKSYMDICVSGIVFIFGYNAVCAMLRGMGDSVRPMVFVAIATVINIGLDFLFVGPMGMRTAGAALATIIAQAVSFILSVIYLMRKGFVFDFKLRSFKLHADKVRLLLKIGLPSAVQNMIVSFSFMILVSIANGMGVAASAAVGISGRINGIAILPGLAIGSSVTSMAGQNLGACRFDRAKHTMYVGMWISLALSVIVFGMVQIMPGQIIGVFTNDAEVLAMGIPYLRVISIDYLLASIVFAYNALATAAGHTTFTFVNSTLNSVLLRAPLALLLGPVMGMAGLALAVPAATLGSIIIGFVYVQRGRWRTRQVSGAAPLPPM
jgi:putative MATE family efflux protein